jgi:hypothetical protein
MKFNRELAIKVALVVAILIVMGVSAHLYSKQKKEHFQEIDVDALRGFSKGDPGSNWDDQDLWNKGDHKVPTIAGGSDSQFKNNIVDMILDKAATASSSGRGSVETGFNTKIATVESEMDAISNKMATNKSEQDVINANQTYRENEPTIISNQIATDNEQDNKKISAAVAEQASKQTPIDNTQDITISAMAAKNTKQDANITKLDLPVGTIMAYAPEDTLGILTDTTSIRYELHQKGWAVCDSVSSANNTGYNEEDIPDLTDRFLKGHNFITAIPTNRSVNSKHEHGQGSGFIKLDSTQLPSHHHTFKAVRSREWGADDDSIVRLANSETKKYTNNTGSGAPIDIRPPFYKVVYIMKFNTRSV